MDTFNPELWIEASRIWMEPTPRGVVLMFSAQSPCPIAHDFSTRIDTVPGVLDITFRFVGVKDGEVLFRASGPDQEQPSSPALPVPLLGLSTRWPEVNELHV